MKKLLLACLVLLGCGPAVGPPPVALVATATLTDYQYIGNNTYYYYDDCRINYYSDNTYTDTCTYTADDILIREMIHIGDTLVCPGPSYEKIDYVNDNLDMMDYTVYCE